jgi:pimeloyl-ACP methyl ester carboxylesterase
MKSHFASAAWEGQEVSTADTFVGTIRGERLPDGLRWVRVNGVNLPYVERGTGQPVVLVHGGIGDLTAWEPLLQPVAERYRGIAYSRRYAWPGEPIPEGIDDQMLPHVDDLIAFVEALDLGRVHLVGNSWGGFICLLAALKRPDLLRSMVVQEPPVVPLFLSIPPKPWELLAVVVSRPRTAKALLRMMKRGVLPSIAAFKRNDLEAGVRLFVQHGAWGPAAYARIPDDVMRHMLLDARTARAQMLGKGFPRFTPADARAIRVPTLVMNGAISPEHFHRLADRLAELIPNVERVEIPDASHMMHWQSPDATARAILDFLDRHIG